MNCRDVTGILDDHGVDNLDSTLRRQAEAHVATCADCGRVWHLQSFLATLPDMALPADLQARCRAQVAAGSGAVSDRRRANRVLLVGTLTAVAAAAVVLALLLRPTATAPDRTVRVAGHKIIPAAVEVAPAEHVAELPAAAVAVEVASTPSFTVRLVLPAEQANAQKDATSGSSSNSQSAALQSLQDEEQRVNPRDPFADQALQSLYVALVEELRKVPGLVLVDSDPAIVTSSSRNYRVKIGLATMLSPDGHVMRKDARYVSVGVGVEQLQPGGKVIHRLSTGMSIDLLANCSGAAAVADTPCRDVRATAAQIVRSLREQTFPPDSSVTRPLQARLRDTSLDTAQRFKALAELFKLQNKTGDTDLLSDPITVRTAMELAAGATPVFRAQVWRSMRGVGNPALIQPLTASLVQDSDEVRLAAAEILAADFSADPRARAALETAAIGDPRALVRAMAERGLSGEATWRQYVVSSLENPRLPATERVEALVYELYPPGPEAGSTLVNPNYSQTLHDLLDDGALRALAEALPNADKVPGGVNNLLGNVGALYNKNPVIVDMLLAYLDHGSEVLGRMTAAEVLAHTHANEPEVRDALAKAIKSDPDPRVGNLIRQVMGTNTP